ncbi:MAG TPA: TetR/AcrR family transcriptional regulator [Puia sp.]|jgi:AcrR family transcriptional regulator|nr:TetR/AcrR family transcriptional regulator [Puia sp.]
MKNKEIQGQRMRGYFLAATKDLLKAEGLRSVNVRSIADKAGYSPATMYSYFKDANELVFLCVHDFYEECKQHVRNRIKGSEKGVDGLKTAVKAYATFFIQYPGVFELFFIEKMGDLGNKKGIADLINTSLDQACEEEWIYCISRKLLHAEEVEGLKAQIRYTVFGLLLLYLNRRVPASYTEFANQLNLQLDAILQPRVTGSARSTSSVKVQHSAVHNSLISVKIGNNR